ncbi:MAG: thioredoxin family protein [Chlamydiota bacterium]|nr:thioredoxin family protein [Chlamydiota bacterium]
MFRPKKLWILCASIMLAGPVLSQAGVRTSDLAPDFSLLDTDGQVLALSDFKGKYVVLEWCNHECPFVKKHYNSANIPGLQKKYTQLGVVWLTIASSAKGKQGYFDASTWNDLTRAKGASPTAVLLDSSGQVGRLYGAKTTPHMFIIDPEGRLIYQGSIDSIASADDSDIEKADNYVGKALDEALSGQAVSISTTKSYGCSVKYE